MTDRRGGLMGGVPAPAKWLGLAGLIPFVLGAAAVVAAGPQTPAVGVLEGYGVAILSFMGGCRWGFGAAGLGEGATWRMLGLSVMPALYAWGAAFAGAPASLVLLALGFLALLAADIALARQDGAPEWWPALRWPLSLGAAGSLAVAALV